jgi:hypothetical protein
MNDSIIGYPTDQRIVWRFHREDYGTSLLNHFEEAIALLRDRPFVFLIDLRSIRYILPDDKKLILQIVTQSEAYEMIRLVYLVDIRNYIRMQLLISLNQLPYEEMVFKYEANAWEYLDGLVKKGRREHYIKLF